MGTVSSWNVTSDNKDTVTSSVACYVYCVSHKCHQCRMDSVTQTTLSSDECHQCRTDSVTLTTLSSDKCHQCRTDSVTLTEACILCQ